jgi:hypothetical protein
MAMMKDFSLGAILSVAQHRMIAPQGPQEVFGLICHVLLGPDAQPAVYVIEEHAVVLCAEELRRQFDWLERVPSRPGADFTHASIRDWAQLDQLESRLGPRHLVRTKVSPSTR